MVFLRLFSKKNSVSPSKLPRKELLLFYGAIIADLLIILGFFIVIGFFIFRALL
ncbi:MAG: hypothetical protein ACQESC_04530 [Nanobdellota archaeon]